MPRQRRDKTTGLPLPSPVVPATNICVKIQIPNAPEYRQAFRGVLSELGNYWMWQQTEGESNQPALQAAQIWRDALSTLEYLIECGDDMTCADVANCIETNPAARAAVQALVPSTPQNGLLYPPTVPLSPSQMTSRLNPIDECSNDAFWAQVQQWLDFLVELGQDVLEKLELYSNAIEAGDNVPMGQFLGKLKNGSTAGKVLEFLEWALEVVKEAYEAENTLANRQDLQCALFCEMKDDCLISIDGTLSVINQRLGGFLTPSELDDLPSLVDAFITLGSNPSTMLDLWILFLMGTAKTAGMFGLEGIDETINLVLALAVNDANNDWELLCEDCNTETWCYRVNLQVSTDNVELVYTQDGVPYVTQFQSGVGIVGARSGFLDENIPKIVLPAPRVLTYIGFGADIGANTSGAGAYAFQDGVLTAIQGVSPSVTGYEFVPTTALTNFVMFGLDRTGLDRTPIGNITSIELRGIGSNPFGADNC